MALPYPQALQGLSAGSRVRFDMLRTTGGKIRMSIRPSGVSRGRDFAVMAGRAAAPQ